MRETVSDNKWYVCRCPGSSHKYRRIFLGGRSARLAAGDRKVSQPVHRASRVRIYPAFRIRALEKNLHARPRLDSSFRRGNLQHRRAHRSRAAFQFTLFRGHWTDRLERSRLSLIWLPWSSGSSACIPWPPRSCCLAFSASSRPPASPSTLWAAARWVRKWDSSRRACPSLGLSFSTWDEQVEQDRAPPFSFISSNWRGEPLRDYETIVHLIAKTTTAKGLQVTSDWTAANIQPAAKSARKK